MALFKKSKRWHLYYVLKCFSNSKGHLARIEYRDEDPFCLWNSGEREFLTNLPELPLRAKVVTDPQTIFAEFWATPLPLMTKHLHHVLVGSGVNNLDVYPTVLTDSRSGEETTNYLAFNLIGLVSCRELASGVADDQRLLMFRLAESIELIVVEEKVKMAIEAAGIDNLTFLAPEDWLAWAQQ